MGDSPEIQARGTRPTQRPGHSLGSRTGSQHIIDHQNMETWRQRASSEGSMQVRTTCGRAER